MQVTRPKYFFPGLSPQQLSAKGKVGPVGQASAALEGLIVNSEVYLLGQQATGPKGAGTLIEFIPNPIPNGYQTGMPSEGWVWFEFDAGEERIGLIGWPEGEEIGPENFARESDKLIEGHEATDVQGRHWIIPIARQRINPFGKLPTCWKPTKAGLKEFIARKAETIWNFAGECFDYLRAVNHAAIYDSPLEAKWHDPYGIEAAIRAIGINHHFGYAEMLLLDGLGCNPLERDFAVECLQCLVGYQGLLDYHEQKKNRDQAQQQRQELLDSTADSPSLPSGELAEAI